MKKPQQLFASIILVGLLSVSAFAGDGIMTTGIAEPTPTPTPVTTTNEGIIHTGFTSADPAAEVALSLLQGVLALF